MAVLKDQNEAIMDFWLSGGFDNVLYKSEDGNLNLGGGKLEAEGIVAGAMTIQIVDEEKKTIGTAEIKAVTIDEDLNGYDDLDAAVNGKEARVMTKAVTDSAKIFVTPQGNIGSAYWVEKNWDDLIQEYTGFTIYTASSVTAGVKIDWFIVESAD
jgi:hypothetical protein